MFFFRFLALLFLLLPTASLESREAATNNRFANQINTLAGVDISDSKTSKINTYRFIPFDNCKKCPLVDFEMVSVPQGVFYMGDSQKGYFNEMPVHKVIVDYDFEIGRFEVTQKFWNSVMSTNPAYFWDCINVGKEKDRLNWNECPVESVSWDEVQVFLMRLNMKTGKNFRLPTEAEWEYACRANQYKDFCGGEKFDNVAWFNINSGGRTHAVGQRQPNQWGIYDMSGNVWEWVEDNWTENYVNSPKNSAYAVKTKGKFDNLRVLRGGAWDISPKFSRASNRMRSLSSMKLNYFGFRIARTIDTTEE